MEQYPVLSPGAGEAEEEGYEDEYQLEDIDIGASTYIKPAPLPNFRRAWEDCNPDSELSDDYGLGQRDSLQVLLLSEPPLHRHWIFHIRRCFLGVHTCA
jgi:hypothetical protein